MINNILFILLISINCITSFEESKTTEAATEILERTESFTANADTEELVIKAKTEPSDGETSIDERSAPDNVVEERRATEETPTTNDLLQSKKEEVTTSDAVTNDRREKAILPDASIENRREEVVGPDGRIEIKREEVIGDVVIKDKRREAITPVTIPHVKQDEIVTSNAMMQNRRFEMVTPDEVLEDRRTEGEADEPKIEKDIVKIVQDESRKSSDMEKLSQKLPDTPSSDTNVEERKAEDISEASAEHTFSNIAKSSSDIDESDRSSDSGSKEIKEKSDGNLPKTKMPTDNIVLYAISRSGDTTTDVNPQVKVAPKENLNTNNYNEFETRNNIQLIAPGVNPTGITGNRLVFTPRPVTIKTTTPVVVTVESQEIFRQSNLPTFYPTPGLDLNFPNIQAQLQGSFELPIYFKLDQVQKKNRFSGGPNSQLTSSEENKQLLNPGYQQQYFSPPGLMIPQKKQLNTFKLENRNQDAQLYKQVTRDFKITPDLKNFQNAINQVHQNQGTVNSAITLDNQRFQNIYHEPKNQIQAFNTKMTTCNVCKPNINNQNNHIKQFYQTQGAMDTTTNFDSNHINFAKPYPYRMAHSFRTQDINIMKNDQPSTGNFQMLYQKLTDSSGHPRMYQSSSENMLKFPHHENLNS